MHAPRKSVQCQLESVTPLKATALICDELHKFAIPWFAKHRSDIAADRLVQYGLSLLKGDQTKCLTLDDLKSNLRKEADRVNATRWQRREIAILARDLLSLRDEFIGDDSSHHDPAVQ
jgi:hypothetical protein